MQKKTGRGTKRCWKNLLFFSHRRHYTSMYRECSYQVSWPVVLQTGGGAVEGQLTLRTRALRRLPAPPAAARLRVHGAVPAHPTRDTHSLPAHCVTLPCHSHSSLCDAPLSLSLSRVTFYSPSHSTHASLSVTSTLSFRHSHSIYHSSLPFTSSPAPHSVIVTGTLQLSRSHSRRLSHSHSLPAVPSRSPSPDRSGVGIRTLIV